MWPINTQQHGTLQNKKVHIRSSAQKIQDTETHTVTHTHTMWAGLGLTGAALFIHTALLPVKAIQSTCAHTQSQMLQRSDYAITRPYPSKMTGGGGGGGRYEGSMWYIGLVIKVGREGWECWCGWGQPRPPADFPHTDAALEKKKSLSLKCCCSGGRRSGCSYTARPAGEITTVCDICFDIQMPSYKEEDEHIQEGGKRRTTQTLINITWNPGSSVTAKGRRKKLNKEKNSLNTEEK